MSMEIVLASSAGFCFGVRRAVKLLEEELEKQSEIYSLGEIIHNRIFVSNLEKRGVKIIDSADIPLLKKGSRVFIRTHGVEKGVYSLLEENGLCYTDATCPYVKKTHTIVENETKNKIPCIIFGDSNHPEVKGIRSHCEGESFIVNSKEELSELLNSLGESKIKSFFQSGLVMLAQTTSKLSEWEKCSEYIKKIIPCAYIFDTICRVTEERHNEVR
ncbi:MAG: 4-hydroxy-3-methylbut-2-enyl diphosphate reductase [Clostridia bacterium]|nr:4-hydroxy-3-methylbut-2-enyl diphosphate reductase [Clostridia bacterium]